MIVGTEWLIEAEGCDPNKLRDEALLRATFDRIIDELGLKAIDSVWHKFDGMGGVTGLTALTESHLACHTYPEHQTATFNLYCCRTRPEWAWETNLGKLLGAVDVRVTKIERGGGEKFEISNLKSEIVAKNGESLSTASSTGSRIHNPQSAIRIHKSLSAGGEN